VSDDTVSIEQILERDGTLALPHYIHRMVAPADSDDYQTVYASQPGAIAAPTAGLHFTDDIFKEMAAAGVRTATVTLHIGLALSRRCVRSRSRAIRWNPNGSRFQRRPARRSSIRGELAAG